MREAPEPTSDTPPRVIGRVAGRVAAIATLAGVYWIAARLGLQLAFVHESATAVWPATGIAIAALLLGGSWLWPGVALGAFAVNVAGPGGTPAALGIAAGNLLEAVVAAALVRRFANGVRFFEDPVHVFRYTLLAGVLAPVISASAGVLTLSFTGFEPARGWDVWRTWWMGDAAGALVVAPLLVTWARARPRRWPAARVYEAAINAAAVAAVSLLVFQEPLADVIRNRPTAYLCFPVLTWTAFRFGARETMTATVLMGAIAIGATLQGRGPFARADANESLLLLQGFVAVIAVLHLTVSAAITRRERSEEMLREVQSGLERAVGERTALLESANGQLQETQDRLLEAQRLAAVGSWEWDIASDRVWWSAELCRLYGVDPAGFHASYQAFLDRVHPDDRERVHAHIAAALEDRRPFRFEHRIVRADGTSLTLEAQGRVVPGEDGRPARMMGTGQDVSERKRAEEERALLLREQIARREAEEANRMKDAFLATLSHELRTPLNSILGWTGLLNSEAITPEDARRGLEAIQRNAQAQSRLISDILDLTSIESGKLELNLQRAELAAEIESAVEGIRPEAARKHLKIETALERNIPVRADADRMRQVVLNLLSNAVKFVPEGGRVAVRLSREDDSCRLVVEDDGPGIPPELLPHVFDRFRQGDSSSTRQHRGLGLGLAIVQRLVALHGGSTEAANRDNGGGARITVRLPLGGAGAPARGAAGIGKWQTLPVLRGLRVLLVDDDDDSREVSAEILRRAGAAVIAAHGAAAARRALQSGVPDVLVTDIEMPGEDGYTLVATLRSEGGTHAALPALALTAYVRPEDQARARESGFDAFLPKPVDPEALIRQVGALAHLRKPART